MATTPLNGYSEMDTISSMYGWSAIFTLPVAQAPKTNTTGTSSGKLAVRCAGLYNAPAWENPKHLAPAGRCLDMGFLMTFNNKSLPSDERIFKRCNNCTINPLKRFNQYILSGVYVQFDFTSFVQWAIQDCHQFLMYNVWSILFGIFVMFSHQTNMIVTIQQLIISFLRFYCFQRCQIQNNHQSTSTTCFGCCTSNTIFCFITFLFVHFFRHERGREWRSGVKTMARIRLAVLFSDTHKQN